LCGKGVKNGAAAPKVVFLSAELFRKKLQQKNAVGFSLGFFRKSPKERDWTSLRLGEQK
jgi:hypothetical protein